MIIQLLFDSTSTHATELVLDSPGFFCYVRQLKRSRSSVKMF